MKRENELPMIPDMPSDRDVFYAYCTACDTRHKVCDLPMEMTKFCEVVANVKCPECGAGPRLQKLAASDWEKESKKIVDRVMGDSL